MSIRLQAPPREPATHRAERTSDGMIGGASAIWAVWLGLLWPTNAVGRGGVRIALAENLLDSVLSQRICFTWLTADFVWRAIWILGEQG